MERLAGRTRTLAAMALAIVCWGCTATQALAASRTINFDDAAAPSSFASTTPLGSEYAALGVSFAGSGPGSGGARLNSGGGFGVTGFSAPNFLAFNTGVGYPGGGSTGGPETITFASPAHSVSIAGGQGTSGTMTVTAYDGTTAVSAVTRASTPALTPFVVRAPRITSVQLAFTGSASAVFDDLTWETSPLSAVDAYETTSGNALVAVPGVLANDADPDGDVLTAQLTRPPLNGDLAWNSNGSFTYTPHAGFAGLDSFAYRPSDGSPYGPETTVTVTVKAPAVTPAPPAPPVDQCSNLAGAQATLPAASAVDDARTCIGTARGGASPAPTAPTRSTRAAATTPSPGSAATTCCAVARVRTSSSAASAPIGSMATTAATWSTVAQETTR